MTANQEQDFMRQALVEARAALDAGEFPVGCVLVRDGVIVARGRRSNSRGAAANEMDHAEIAALRSYLRSQGGGPAPVTVYATMEPCLMCYATLLLSGVRHIVYAYEDCMGGGTGLDLASLPGLYRGMQVTVTPGVLRREALALFQEFFRAPENGYWSGSELARYTMAQDAGGGQ